MQMLNLRMPTTAQAAAVTTVVFGAFAACLFSGWPNQRAADVVSALSFPTLGLVLVPLAVVLAGSSEGRLRATWVAMAIGLAGWVTTEVIWAYYAITREATPIPSPADAAYLVFLSGVLSALLLFPGARSLRGQGRTILDGFILTGSFFLISWLAVLRSIVQSGTGGLQFAASLVYPAGDFLLLTVGFLVLLRVTAQLRLTLALLVAALACNAVADGVWAYLSQQGRYTPGSLSDVLAAGGALLMIVALVAAYRTGSGAIAPETSPSRLALWLPLVPLAVAALFLFSAPPDVVLETPVVITVGALIVATLIRQVLEAAEAVRREQHIRVLADRLETELDTAAKYVASILPGELNGPVHVTSRYLPSRAVGGDSFGYTWLPGDGQEADHLVVYLIDVSGHGVEPALLSVSIHNLLRSGSLPETTLLAPDRVLGELNDLFTMERHAGHYFTMWYGVYQLSTGLLRYASAGHPPALALTREGDRIAATRLGRGSMPVGMFGDTEFTVESYHVPAGTRILLYSDGVLGDAPDMEEFVALCTELAATPAYSLDSLLSALPTAAEGPDVDDRSLVQLTFP